MKVVLHAGCEMSATLRFVLESGPRLHAWRCKLMNNFDESGVLLTEANHNQDTKIFN